MTRKTSVGCWKSLSLELLLTLLIFHPAASRAEEALKQRYLNEARQSWADYAAYAERLQCTVTHEATHDGKPRFHRRIEFKQNLKCRLTLSQSLLSHSPDCQVVVSNPEYAFSLRRGANSHPWSIINLDKLAGDPVPGFTGDMLDQSKLVLCTLTHPYLCSLRQLAAQPTFRVLDATRVQRNGLDLVRIDFDNTHPINSTSYNASMSMVIQAGSMWLDPNRFWCFHACDFQVKHTDAQGTAKVEAEYQDLSAKYPLPKRYVESRDLRLEGGERDTRVTVKTFVWNDASRLPPDEDFTLQAFGLRVPPGIALSGSSSSSSSMMMPLFVWVALAGFVLIGLCSLFAWRVRRRRRTPMAS